MWNREQISLDEQLNVGANYSWNCGFWNDMNHCSFCLVGWVVFLQLTNQKYWKNPTFGSAWSKVRFPSPPLLPVSAIPTINTELNIFSSQAQYLLIPWRHLYQKQQIGLKVGCLIAIFKVTQQTAVFSLFVTSLVSQVLAQSVATDPSISGHSSRTPPTSSWVRICSVEAKSSWCQSTWWGRKRQQLCGLAIKRLGGGGMGLLGGWSLSFLLMPF